MQPKSRVALALDDIEFPGLFGLLTRVYVCAFFCHDFRLVPVFVSTLCVHEVGQRLPPMCALLQTHALPNVWFSNISCNVHSEQTALRAGAVCFGRAAWQQGSSFAKWLHCLRANEFIVRYARVPDARLMRSGASSSCIIMKNCGQRDACQRKEFGGLGEFRWHRQQPTLDIYLQPQRCFRSLPNTHTQSWLRG